MTYRQKRNSKKTLVAFEIPAQDLKAVRKIAEEQDRNVSYVLRSAVQTLLAAQAN